MRPFVECWTGDCRFRHHAAQLPLVLIGAIEALPSLFNEVFAPPAVLHELSDAAAPALVRSWAAHPPDWLKVRPPSVRLPSTAVLDPGEAEAISLAKEIGARVVLMDENKGRKVALMEGLTVVRTLALIESAAQRQLLELRPTLDRLAATTFRISRDLIEAALARAAAREVNR